MGRLPRDSSGAGRGRGRRLRVVRTGMQTWKHRGRGRQTPEDQQPAEPPLSWRDLPTPTPRHSPCPFQVTRALSPNWRAILWGEKGARGSVGRGPMDLGVPSEPGEATEEGGVGEGAVWPLSNSEFTEGGGGEAWGAPRGFVLKLHQLPQQEGAGGCIGRPAASWP